MLRKFFRFIFLHFSENKFLYFTAGISVIFGILLGIAGGKNFSDSDYLLSFFSGLAAFRQSSLVFRAFVSALLISAAAVIFGLSPAGIFALPFIDAYRGFAAGFSAAAFYSVYGIKSFVFIFIALVIPAVLWLPPLIFASVTSMRTSFSVMKICRRSSAPVFMTDVRYLGGSVAVMFVFMLLSRLAEIYVVPPILNAVSGLYI